MRRQLTPIRRRDRYPLRPPISDTAENIACALLTTSPGKAEEWEFMQKAKGRLRSK